MTHRREYLFGACVVVGAAVLAGSAVLVVGGAIRWIAFTGERNKAQWRRRWAN